MISHDNLAEFSAVLWPALAGHLWQATLVAGLCLLALPAFRGAGAKLRHILWALAFVRFAIPQALVFFAAGHFGLHLGLDSGIGTRLQQVSDVVAPVTQPSMLASQQQSIIGSAATGHPEVYCILTMIWIAGFTLFLGAWWLRQHRFARSMRMARDENANQIIQMIASLKNRLGIGRRKRLRVVSGGAEPGVFGIWRPVVVLPEDISKRLSPAEIEAVLAHELVHVARRDNLWSNLQMIVCCIFWFYPVVWLLDRRLIAEREQACDERVIEVFRNSQAYASGLIKMMSIGLGLAVAGVSSMAGANLKRRIENIMSNKKNNKSGLSARILFSSIAALAVLLYLVAAPLHKSMAQAAPYDLAIVDSGDSPLKIESATVTDISAPPQPNKDLLPHIINPKIALKNYSDRIVQAYVLEFRKTGFASIYLARPNIALAPKGTDLIETKTPNTLIYAGDKVTEAVRTWTVRLDVVTFKDGKVLTLHPSPIPPPPNTVPGGIVGGRMGKGITPVPPPPRNVIVTSKDGKVSTLNPSPIPPPRNTVPGSVVGGRIGAGTAPVSPKLLAMQSATPGNKQHDPIQVSEKVQESKLIKRVAIYPALAKNSRVQGRVALAITIDEEGNVVDAKVTDGHPLLNDAAVAAVKQWKYNPTFLNNKPVPVATTVQVDFNLK